LSTCSCPEIAKHLLKFGMQVQYYMMMMHIYFFCEISRVNQ